jgi:carbamoyl-phosphate synthase large subunit
VDCISDGTDCVVAGIMEHIEEAGVHSGDSACALPPYSLRDDQIAEIEEQTKELAKAIKVVGLMNVQFAIAQGRVYILEVNPRASRTIPFVSKAIGHPLAKYAARVMVGETLAEIGFTEPVRPPYFSVKEAVFPFNKFPGVDVVLGPEMRSTGEVMGIDPEFHGAFYKAQMGAGNALPQTGTVFISVRDRDKGAAIEVARLLSGIGMTILATKGTAESFRKADIPVESVNKVREGRPHIVDRIINGDVDLVINTTIGRQSLLDSHSIRQQTVRGGIPYCTTIAAAKVAARAMVDQEQSGELTVRCLQDYHRSIR